MRYRFIAQHKEDYPIRLLCQVMQVSHSGYYAWCQRPEASPRMGKITQIKQRLKALFIEHHKRVGSRTLTALLRKEGYCIGRHRVRRLMKEMALIVTSKRRRVCTTDSRHGLPIAENRLNRQFNPQKPNQVWTTDITYIPTVTGWVYLAVIIDLYSRKVVGWHVSDTMEAALVSRALTMAVNLNQPPKGLLHHSDRGSQYASRQYQQLLEQHGMICSMSRKGNCWDNAPTERFFRTLKYDWIGKRHYRHLKHARDDIAAFMRYYNLRRPHSVLGYMSPVAYEKAMRAKCA